MNKIREGMVEILCGYGDDVRIENCDACLSYDEANNRCKKAAPIQKIREGIDKIIDEGCFEYPELNQALIKPTVARILTFLDANGLVIWKEKELPENPYEPPLDVTQEGWRDVVEARTKQMVKHIEDCKERLI